MSTTLDDLRNASPDEAERLNHERRVQFHLKNALAKEEAARRLRGDVTITLLTEAEFDALPVAQWIVPNLILASSLGLAVGEPGSLKTFTWLDLALSIASGQPKWLDRPLYAHGAVVYVVGEGQGRFKYRKDVWKQEHRVTGPLPFYIVPKPLNLRDPVLMDAFLKQITVHQPKLIVFDTLSRCLPGTDENSAKDIGEAINACNQLQQATGAAVQLLHHPRKDGGAARGSSATLGAVESELWMSKTSDKYLFTLTAGKQKEGDDSLSIDLKKKVVELAGIFEYGQPVTSCVVEVATPQDVKNAAASLERLILEWVQKNPAFPKAEMPKQLNQRRQPVIAAIDQLVREGRLSESLGGRGNRAKLLTFVSWTVAPPTLGGF